MWNSCRRRSRNTATIYCESIRRLLIAIQPKGNSRIVNACIHVLVQLSAEPTQPPLAISMEHFWSPDVQSDLAPSYFFWTEKLSRSPPSAAHDSKLIRSFKKTSRFISNRWWYHFMKGALESLSTRTKKTQSLRWLRRKVTINERNFWR